MATTGADSSPACETTHRVDLPVVRRLEASSFRAWPASSVHYDGSWQIRLTPDHPSKRLNCIVPLDPFDDGDIKARLQKAETLFRAAHKPLIIKQTPLTSDDLVHAIRAQGWTRFDETIVMTCDLAGIPFPETLNHLPIEGIEPFVKAQAMLDTLEPVACQGLKRILTSISPPLGLFLMEDGAKNPLASVACVQHNDLAGFLLLVVAPQQRRQGLGLEIMTAALRWAQMRQARTGWLQVHASNTAALALYRKFGFREIYRYQYWHQEQA